MNFVTFHPGGRISLSSSGGIFGEANTKTVQRTMNKNQNIPAENLRLCGLGKRRTENEQQRQAAQEFLAAKRAENAIALGKAMKRQSAIAYGQTN